MPILRNVTLKSNIQRRFKCLKLNSIKTTLDFLEFLKVFGKGGSMANRAKLKKYSFEYFSMLS